MDIEIGSEITLGNNSKYVVCDKFELDGKTYLYIAKSDDITKVTITELSSDTLKDIESDEEFDKVFKHLMSRHKEEIEKIVEEASEN